MIIISWRRAAYVQIWAFGGLCGRKQHHCLRDHMGGGCAFLKGSIIHESPINFNTNTGSGLLCASAAITHEVMQLRLTKPRRCGMEGGGLPSPREAGVSVLPDSSRVLYYRGRVSSIYVLLCFIAGFTYPTSSLHLEPFICPSATLYFCCLFVTGS